MSTVMINAKPLTFKRTFISLQLQQINLMDLKPFNSNNHREFNRKVEREREKEKANMNLNQSGKKSIQGNGMNGEEKITNFEL